jgi:hypothetical protein
MRSYDTVVLRVLVVVLTVASCAPTRPPDAPIELTVPPLSGAPIAAAPEAPKTEKCHAIVFAGPIAKSSFGCILDEQVSKHQGIVTYPCTGDGEAEAAFGEQLYTGQIRDGEIELELKTELDWEGDGCRWGTTANIRGRVLTEQKIAWVYRDYVVRGTNCSGTCTASTSLAVRLQGGAKPPPNNDSEDDDDAP